MINPMDLTGKRILVTGGGVLDQLLYPEYPSLVRL